MAGGTIFSGIFNKPYEIKSKETRWGILLTMIPAAAVILLIDSPFQGLLYSQMFLGMQLPITVFTLDLSDVLRKKSWENTRTVCS